ncbi:thiamine pyrophosphate-binding protein [Aquiflexum gelatinilyticum]|uniref:Thiamine pyrophosphate-binding protein n=1 Tax=Aquiflexum gelatinilyticum TaxID=2961943 RepID=A0A9X2P7T6_9BACT|nr:thiamine pyrophosphate-binding protein [Aquiflexum gelatinilyticum]MCR9013795.1 thiamine pyrophosphate-binding protein [Aquiflexum gelatinilyticum]
MNGGEIIAQVLLNHGVKFLFTLCGGHISPIFVGAEKSGIRVIDTRHEATAVFAADAVGRLTGIPGVVAVTAGPGLTNTITAIKNAQMAQSPLILLGGAAATMLKGRGALQDIDQLSIIKPIVKWAVSIKKVKDIGPTLQKAFRIAQEGVPGPVFIECPIDTLYPESMVREWYGAKSKSGSKTLKDKAIQWYIERHAKKLFKDKDKTIFNSHPTKPKFPLHSDSQFAKAVSLIQKAKRPLMILGSGAMLQPELAGQLAIAIDQIGIPVFLSGMGRGLLGRSGRLHIRHKRKEAIKEADLIILAGVPNDFRLDYGSHIGSRKFISINRSKTELFLNKKPTLAIQADPCSFLVALSDHLKINLQEWLDTLRKRDSMRDEEIGKQSEENINGLNPLKLLGELEHLLPEKAVLVADGGDFVATASYTLRVRQPLSWLDPGAYGTLGVGAGFAIAAALVYPDRPVWILYGDGSAGYSLMEFDTFQRHGLAITALIGNDGCWNQIARDQVEFLGSDCAVMLENSDYEKIPNAFGVEGQKVENFEVFKFAVKKALEVNQLGKSFLINAIIGKTDFRKGSISV